LEGWAQARVRTVAGHGSSHSDPGDKRKAGQQDHDVAHRPHASELQQHAAGIQQHEPPGGHGGGAAGRAAGGAPYARASGAAGGGRRRAGAHGDTVARAANGA